MPRLISCAETIPAVLDRSKTVTRRLGWWLDRRGNRLVVPGDELTICGQIMGRKPGQDIVRYATVPIIDVRRELLVMVTDEDVSREGVVTQVTEWRRRERRPDMTLATAFVYWYSETFGDAHVVTRIEWTWDGAVLHDGMTK